MAEREPAGDHYQAFAFIAETAAAAGITAEIIQRYAALGDVAGTRYAVRTMVAYIRACRNGMQIIDSAQAEAAAREGRTP